MRYPYLKGIQKRTHELVVSDVLQVLENRQRGEMCDDVRGIKGPTPLMLLKAMNVAEGSPVDYMHACLRGNTGKFSDLWFDTENKHQKFFTSVDQIKSNTLMRT